MRRYKKAEVSEAKLEDLVRQHPGMIEEGLVYIDHQRSAQGGRLDALLVDSGRSLIVAELKVVQDDGMLLQGVDYYDYVSAHIERLARLYQMAGIDPTQQVRLFLIAPSFSQALVNRCKWLDIPISLFTYTCLRFEGEDDVIPVFTEHTIPTPPELIEVTQLDDLLGYITDQDARRQATTLLHEIESWRPGNISIDPRKGAISIKVNGRVFAYFYPRRKYYQLASFDPDESWVWHEIRSDEDLEKAKPIVRTAMECKAKF